MTTTTSRGGRWGDLVFFTVERAVGALTSRSMWLMVIASAGVGYIIWAHAHSMVAQSLAEFALGGWVTAFLGAAVKRGATQIAAIKANGNGGTGQ